MLTEKPISELVAQVQRADRGAIEALARQFLRPAYLVALPIVGRTADAEDVAQDSIMAAIEHVDECRDPSHFSGWLFQIVRNRARNFCDKRRLRDVPRDAELEESADSSAVDGSEAEPGVRQELQRALMALKPVQREVVLLCDLEGWTHGEVGEALGISEVMSRQHLFVARRMLRRALMDKNGRKRKVEDE